MDSFTIPVTHQGKELDLPANLLRMGYTYKIQVFLNAATEVLFERDDDGNFRAIIPAGTDEKTRNSIDKELLQKVAETLKESLEK